MRLPLLALIIALPAVAYAAVAPQPAVDSEGNPCIPPEPSAGGCDGTYPCCVSGNNPDPW